MRSCRNQLTTPENLIHRTQTCLLCPMIRRSFVQILSGFLLPVPAQKSAVSQAVAPSGSLARFPFATGAISQSPFVSASNYDCPPFTAASKDAPYYKESATQYSPNSAPGCATPVTENQDFWSTRPLIALNPDPEWLREWHRIPRLEIREDELSHYGDGHQRDIAAVILPRIRAGAAFAFRYLGGSMPGEIRRVLPTSLFRLDFPSRNQGLAHDPGDIPEPADSPIYLLAWCLSRNAPRTFRLDRILPTEN